MHPDNITRYGPDSYLCTNFFSNEEGSRIIKDLDDQLEYVPREELRYRGHQLGRSKNFQCDVVDSSLTSYQYPGSRKDVWGPWTNTGRELRDVLRTRTGEQVNSLVANLYVDGNDKITAHSDKPEDIQRSTSILTISLGATRTLELTTNNGSKTIHVPLPHGSLFVLGWKTNAQYKHAVLRTDEGVGRRFGLTFRTLASRWFPEENVLVRQPPTNTTYSGWKVYTWREKVRKQLAPFYPADPARLQEADVTRLRAQLPVMLAATALTRRRKATEEQAEDECCSRQVKRGRAE